MCFFSSQDVFNRAHSESYVLPSLPQTGVTIFTFAFLQIPLQEQCSCGVPWITDLWHDSPNLHDSFPHLSKRKPVGRRTIRVQIMSHNIWYNKTISIKWREKFPSIKLTSFASTRRNLCFIRTYITFVTFDSRFTYTFSWHLFTVVSHWAVRRTVTCFKRKKTTLRFALYL